MAHLYYPVCKKPGLPAGPVYVLGGMTPVEGPHMEPASQHPEADSAQSHPLASIQPEKHIMAKYFPVRAANFHTQSLVFC